MGAGVVWLAQARARDGWTPARIRRFFRPTLRRPVPRRLAAMTRLLTRVSRSVCFGDRVVSLFLGCDKAVNGAGNS
jgi:hypothetical protein